MLKGGEEAGSWAGGDKAAAGAEDVVSVSEDKCWFEEEVGAAMSEVLGQSMIL